MTTQLVPDHLDVTPSLALDLVDADRVVGWIVDDRVGFRGFADELEAAHAAWVAYRTLTRRLARTQGTRPIPVDTEPLALERRGDQEAILASGRPIAVLVRPGVDSASGPDTFGFELRIPAPADGLRVRSMAHLMYRTLRKSGLRWALWRSPAGGASGSESSTRVPAGRDGARDRTDDSDDFNGGASDVTETSRRQAWRIPALPWRRADRLDRRRSGRVPGIRQR